MDVNDNDGSLTHRGALRSIASELAPTGDGVDQFVSQVFRAKGFR